MGNTIRKEMEETVGYEDAIAKMRQLSLRISGNFRETVEEMKACMDALTPKIK